jgi:protein gp37
MAENTAIEWADHTFNPWTGCTKVSPACDHCYAESWAKRSGTVRWGPGEPRRRTTDANWRQPLKWNAQAQREGRRFRVFCASLADVFDNEVPVQWRVDLFRLIASTPHLDWLLLTKRIGNALPMMREVAQQCGGVKAHNLGNIFRI